MDNNALDNNVNVRSFIPRADNDITAALAEIEDDTRQFLRQKVDELNGIKWWISLHTRFTRVSPEGEEQYTDTVFHSETYRGFQGHDINNDIADAFKHLYTQAEEFVASGSGWSVDIIEKIEINAVRHNPLQVGTYIPTPNGLKGVVNVKNNDNKCIIWSILANFYPAKQNSERLNKYTARELDLNVTGVRFPTPIADIKKIEEQNNMSIHVFLYDKEVTPFRISKQEKDRHVNLLILNDADRFHYVLIRSFRLLLKEKSTNVKFCFNCLQRFSHQKYLDNHKPYCIKTQKTVFPEENEYIHFKSHQRQLRAPFVIYADFECFTKKTDHPNEYQRHIPSGFCYHIVSTAEQHNKGPISYTGPDVVEKFFDNLMEEESRIETILSQEVDMIWNDTTAKDFEEATDCYICDLPLGADRVRDHDHLTGEYRGAAHNECNLKFRWSKSDPMNKFGFRIPVIFHNLRGYDSHLLMEAFGSYKMRRLWCVANNSERYVTFSTGALTFIDSFQFMASSLENLVRNLAQEGSSKFKNLCKIFPKKYHLLLRKGVFPYDYFDNECKLDNTKLPTQQEFFSVLTQEQCSDTDYKHACNVWKAFNCQSFRDYHDLYMTSDVLQLADVFESFRDMTLETYKLDPANYCTAPSLSWDSMLR